MDGEDIEAPGLKQFPNMVTLGAVDTPLQPRIEV